MTTTDDDRIREHAAAHPLIERLRGRHWIPGVHAGLQTDAWMSEAADEIERLSAPPKIETIFPISHEVPNDAATLAYVRRSAREAALEAVDRILVETRADRLSGDEAWKALRELDPDAPDPFLTNLDVVRITWKLAVR